MLKNLKEIILNKQIKISENGDFIPLHSHTSLDQGLFMQEMFDLAKPLNTLEVGLAYGISAMFILEKHREINPQTGRHIAIEPDEYWGSAAIYNITKENLDSYLEVKHGFSDEVLPNLYYDNTRLQYAYIDTTKRFDIVMHDFYFIDKMLDISGVIILDDCGGVWPGIQRVARYINTLDNYKIVGRHCKNETTLKKKVYHFIINRILNFLPFKDKIYPTIDFHSDIELGLDYSCIAFQKISEDKRDWRHDRLI